MAKSDKSAKTGKGQQDQEQPSVEDVVDTVVVEDPLEAGDVNETPDQAGVDADGSLAGATEPSDTVEIDLSASEDPEEQSEATAETQDDSAGALEDNVAAPSQVIVQARPSFLPLIGGGVIAAGLGFGVAQYIGPIDGSDITTLTVMSEQLDAQAVQIEALSASQANNAAALKATASDIGAVKTSVKGISDLKASFAVLGAQVDGVESRLIELEKRPMTEGASGAAIAAYGRELQDLKDAVASQRADAAAMEQNAALTAQQALARAAMTRVLSAVDSGVPYRAALVDLGLATGASIPDVLDRHADTGVPTLLSLQDSYPQYARAALAAARNVGQDDSAGSRLALFLKSQLGARSVTAKEGADADSVLSRAEAALRAGRLTDALAEIEMLPEVARAAMTDWSAEADKRRTTSEAVEKLAQSLNNN